MEKSSINSKQTKINSGFCLQQQNVGFIDQEHTPMVGPPSATDPTVHQDDNNVADLARFLARPVDIWSTTIPVGASMPGGALGIKPWHLWASNTYVKAKLDNFYLFRGDLKMKIVINGTPFHFGRFFAFYTPLASSSNLQADGGLMTLSDENFVRNVISMSQRPKVYLNPTDSQGGCLCAPFFWPRNYIKVNTITDWEDLGELGIQQIAPLETANGSSEPVHITVFAWVENAELKVPTTSLAVSEGCVMSNCKGNKCTYPDVSYQSDVMVKDKDEYAEEADNSGVISRPAAAIAKAAGLLTSVPVIGPFAMATEIGAGAIGRIASLFGYSRPNLISPPSFMRRENFGTMSYTSSSDSIIKLTLDPKQQLSVDPRTVGLDTGDEMGVYDIAKHESYGTYFNWSASDVEGTDLFFCHVNPLVLFKSMTPIPTPTAETWYQPTALDFASIPFRYWSGTIVYRFEIVASAYHRGRLKLSWDPYSRANAQNANNINVAYTKILDLAESRNIEVSISWGVDQPYLKVGRGNLSTYYFTDPHVASAADIPGNNFCNGVFNISVLNTLVSPQTVATPVRINVYVRAGDDFELYEPDSSHINSFSYFPSPEGDVMEKDVAYSDANDPTSTDLITSASDLNQKKGLVFFGDPVMSFRSLVKRYNYHGTLMVATGSTATGNIDYVRWTAPNFPAYYGWDPNGLHDDDDVTPEKLNPYNMTLINYLTPAFVGVKGGVRYKYYKANHSSNGFSFYVDKAHNTCKIGRAQSYITSGMPTTNLPSLNYQYRGNTLDGAHGVVLQQQNVIGVELPFYSPNRFRIARNIDVYTGIQLDSTDEDFNHNITMHAIDADSGATYSRPFILERWVAAGDDFSLFFFLCAPLRHIYDTRVPTKVRPIFTTISSVTD